ncbi:MAG: AmmeMemoRadiSam system radical SAM enzyme [Acidobacteriota bacterium]
MTSRNSRREFITQSFKGLCLLGMGSFPVHRLSAERGLQQEPGEDELFVREARYYKKLEELKVQCELCPRKCTIADLERGYCGVRENRQGSYYTLVYSRPCSIHMDPIEKKPLFHYLPGTSALSLATAGCNIECKFCQNWNISQFRPEEIQSWYAPPQEIVSLAKKYKCPTIAYTYTEPVIFYEYMYDIAQAARKEKIGSVMITNGYIMEQPMVDLCQQLTAVKVDLKAFTEKFYRESCSGELQPVLDILVTLKKMGIWLEIVVLIVPTLNDSPEEIDQMTRWIGENLGRDVPVHFTRYHPTYKIKNIPPTPVKTLEQAREVALKNGMHYVYVGNVPNHPAENTYCASCQKVVIQRVGYRILEVNLNEGKCKFCQNPIPGVWKDPLA